MKTIMIILTSVFSLMFSSLLFAAANDKVAYKHTQTLSYQHVYGTFNGSKVVDDPAIYCGGFDFGSDTLDYDASTKMVYLDHGVTEQLKPVTIANVNPNGGSATGLGHTASDQGVNMTALVDFVNNDSELTFLSDVNMNGTQGGTSFNITCVGGGFVYSKSAS